MPYYSNRFNFTNPGSDAADALLEFLAKREAEKRQAMLDALKRQSDDREFQLRKAQEDRIDRDSKRNFDALEYEREDNRLSRRVDDDIPGDYVSHDEAKLRDKHGYSGTYTTKMLPKADLVLDENGNAPGVSKEEQARQAALPSTITSTTARGGVKFLSQQEAAKARAEAAKAAQDATAERARLDRDSREAMAREGNATRATIAEGTQSARAEREQEKKDAEAARKSDAAQQTIDSVDDALSTVNQLLDENGNLKDGTVSLYGKGFGSRFIPGSAAADADASMNRLTSQQIIGVLGALKAQSRTGASGFGALSEKELLVLQNAASKLNNRYISDDAAKAELVRIRGLLKKQRGYAEKNLRGDQSNKPIKRFNPVTGKVEDSK